MRLLRQIRQLTASTAKALHIGGTDSTSAPSLTGVLSAIHERTQFMSALAGCFSGVNRTDRDTGTKHVISLRVRFHMKRVWAGWIIAFCMIQYFFVAGWNIADAKGICDSVSSYIVADAGDSKYWSPITEVAPPNPTSFANLNQRPEAADFFIGQVVSHSARILSNWLQPCDGKKAEPLRDRERLNEGTPSAMGDAIVRSHGNVNHERAAEMAAPCYDTIAEVTTRYGEGLKNQIGSQAVIMNLFKDGKQFAKPITTIGANGYTFGCRMKRNYNMGARPEGTTGVGTAGNQGLAQGTVVLKYNYIPHVLTGQATNLSVGQYRAFMAAKALELQYDTKDLLEHMNVVIAGAERGGQLAQALNTSATVIASRASNLPGALYLQVGMPVDAYPVGGGTLTTTNNIITAISYDVVAGDTVTLTTGDSLNAGDAIALAGEGVSTVGAFPYTTEGFHSLIASTGSRQGLNPATTGQESWTSYQANAGGVDLTSQLIDELVQFVENRGAVSVDVLFFGSAQINQLVNLGTKELRYNVDNPNGIGKRAIDLGFTTYSYGGRTIIKDKHIRNDRIYAMESDCMAHFVAIPLSLADDEAGNWTRVIGSSASVADAVAALMRMYSQIGILQRSAAGVLTNLSVPMGFALNPQSLN